MQTGTVVRVMFDVPVYNLDKNTLGICIYDDEISCTIIFIDGRVVSFPLVNTSKIFDVLGFNPNVSSYDMISVRDARDDFERGLWQPAFEEFGGGIQKNLGQLISEMIQTNPDYHDYDDANIIGLYRKMDLTEKLVVDNIINYLTGRTLNEIILQLESK